MNWPSPGNDPSYNPDGVTRQNYYGVTGIPDVYIRWSEIQQVLIKLHIDKARWANPAIMSLSATCYNYWKHNFMLLLTVTPHISVPSGTKMLYCE
jgi:hypothetical protein